MTKEDDYPKNEAQTIELASRAENRADKGHLLALAEKWLDLADRAHRLTSVLASSTAIIRSSMRNSGASGTKPSNARDHRLLDFVTIAPDNL